MRLKLKIPVTYPGETYPGETIAEANIREIRYLTHCKNVALILAHTDTVQHGKAKVDEYLKITGNKEIEK